MAQRSRKSATARAKEAQEGKGAAETEAEAKVWLTIEEAGRYLGIESLVTMRELINRAELPLPVWNITPRKTRTCRRWLDEWGDKCRARDLEESRAPTQEVKEEPSAEARKGVARRRASRTRRK